MKKNVTLKNGTREELKVIYEVQSDQKQRIFPISKRGGKNCEQSEQPR